MTRLFEILFGILNLDAFQSAKTSDSVLNEKRIRERRTIVAYMACGFFWLLALLTLPGAPATDPVEPGYIVDQLTRWVSVALVAAGVLAAVVATWMHVSYLFFRRRYE
jgi:hypothetical protein